MDLLVRRSLSRIGRVGMCCIVQSARKQIMGDLFKTAGCRWPYTCAISRVLPAFLFRSRPVIIVKVKISAIEQVVPLARPVTTLQTIDWHLLAVPQHLNPDFVAQLLQWPALAGAHVFKL